mgnify:CR=1 FL=1
MRRPERWRLRLVCGERRGSRHDRDNQRDTSRAAKRLAVPAPPGQGQAEMRQWRRRRRETRERVGTGHLHSSGPLEKLYDLRLSDDCVAIVTTRPRLQARPKTTLRLEYLFKRN